ncbi:zinc finger protein 429-like [Anneissia japonica]|uniref:zinc finger protein 429-like n=1 Tax=Anneissia japonica TaxID=1529436 RepID=UPI0014259EAF|nr:zinc finger protein 429-like [Anneissia japonica]
MPSGHISCSQKHLQLNLRYTRPRWSSGMTATLIGKDPPLDAPLAIPAVLLLACKWNLFAAIEVYPTTTPIREMGREQSEHDPKGHFCEMTDGENSIFHSSEESRNEGHGFMTDNLPTLQSKPHSTNISEEKYLPYECEHCGQKVKDKNDYLNRHLKTHVGERRYKVKVLLLKTLECEHCGKKFNCKEYLKSHVEVHRDEKLYEGEHCGRKFNQKSNMELQMSVHIMVSPYECEQCGKKFRQQMGLKNHASIHTKDNLY